jgi:peptidoglycan lytic transglycosylase
MKKHRLLTLLLLGFISLYGIDNSMATQLTKSINKFKDSTVSYQTLKRLSPYNKLINYFSQFTFFRRNHKVSPDFIRALIIAESSVNPLAVSPKGAMGLGQIMYPTGREAAKELSQSNFKFRHINHQKLAHLQKEDLFDPAINILLTCYLISKYNYKFNGRLELVLSAWNAGEYHKELGEGRPVPYQETHDLIGKINGYYIDLLQKRKRLSIHTRR